MRSSSIINLVILGVIMFIIGPVLMMWSLKTLGVVTIVYSCWQWLACAVLIFVLRGNIVHNPKK